MTSRSHGTSPRQNRSGASKPHGATTMFSYVIRRLLLAIPTLIGMTAVVFFIMALSPGGTAADLMTKGEGMKPQEREAIRAYLNKRYGLDKPLIVQYVRWLNRMSPIGI